MSKMLDGVIPLAIVIDDEELFNAICMKVTITFHTTDIASYGIN